MKVTRFQINENSSFGFQESEVKAVLEKQASVEETMFELSKVTPFCVSKVLDDGTAIIDHPYAW